MSKIGTYNLELQEQANELGYSTTQEMLDHKEKLEKDLAEINSRVETLLQEQSKVRKEVNKLRSVLYNNLGKEYNENQG